MSSWDTCTRLISAENLKAGDTFIHRGVAVTVLRDKELSTDRFGRTIYRFWSTRSDTGATGFYTLGPSGVVRCGAVDGRTKAGGILCHDCKEDEQNV